MVEVVPGPGGQQGDVPDRYTARRNVSGVRPQGAYAAKRCPLRVQYDDSPPAGVEPVPASPVARHMMDAGNVFEAEVFATLMATAEDVVLLEDALRGAELEQATTAAMASGRRLILGGRLPTDLVGRRVGKPDVLVRAEQTPDGPWAYLPVDVKHHKTLDARPGSTVLISALDAPGSEDATALDDWSPAGANKLVDGLQLAHYIRMLQACGHASTSQVGGIIGKERHITWVDLTDRQVQQRWRKKKEDRESYLERYDFEFSYRLDVLAAAGAGTPIVEPVLIGECATCPWQEVCAVELEAHDSLSLLPNHGYQQWYIHRKSNVRTRAQLAALDRDAAALRDAYQSRGDLSELVQAARAVPVDTPVDTPVAALLGRSHAKIAVLHDHGITMAGDLVALPAPIIATAKRPVGKLADAIDAARVHAWGEGQPHRRRGVDRLAVPSADIEIDIDMENALDGSVYLWGALHDGRYISFEAWEPMTQRLEAQVFTRFWDWLTGVRTDAQQAGRSIKVYCWSQTAEIGAMRTGAQLAAEELDRVDDPGAVDAFVGGGQLIDLMEVFTDQIETATTTRLKRAAPLAGFTWEDDDPAGDASMLWHAQAVGDPDPEVRQAQRDRLLTYNRNDVEATAAIRTWMRSASLPSVADLGSPVP